MTIDKASVWAQVEVGSRRLGQGPIALVTIWHGDQCRITGSFDYPMTWTWRMVLDHVGRMVDASCQLSFEGMEDDAALWEVASQYMT